MKHPFLSSIAMTVALFSGVDAALAEPSSRHGNSFVVPENRSGTMRFDYHGSGAQADVYRQVIRSYSGNAAAVSQTGNNNEAAVGQSGRGHVAIISQIGNNNSSILNQRGRNHTAGIFQWGNDETVNLNQRGNADTSLIVIVPYY